MGVVERDPRNLSEVRNPLWDHVGRVHDWRNYVGDATRALWGTFTDEQVMALAADADELAGAEEWD